MLPYCFETSKSMKNTFRSTFSICLSLGCAALPVYAKVNTDANIQYAGANAAAASATSAQSNAKDPNADDPVAQKKAARRARARMQSSSVPDMPANEPEEADH